MKRHIATPVVAAAVAAGLLVTAACSGDGGSSDDGIATAGTGDNAQPGEDTPELDDDETDGEPEGDAIDRPVIELPDDMVNVFEDTETGDEVKDAIIADVVEGINAIDLGFAEGSPEHEAIAFYTIEDALDGAQAFVEQSSTNGLSWAGRVVYSQFEVDNDGRRADEPIVTYCVDESELRNKELDTGTVHPKGDGANDHFSRQAALRQNSLGVWQVFKLTSAGETRDEECRR